LRWLSSLSSQRPSAYSSAPLFLPILPSIPPSFLSVRSGSRLTAHLHTIAAFEQRPTRIALLKSLRPANVRNRRAASRFRRDCATAFAAVG
jgi:hypothetical protein